MSEEHFGHSDNNGDGVPPQINNNFHLYSTFQETQGCFPSKQINTNKLAAKSLCEQVSLQCRLKRVQSRCLANLRWERVPEGRGCHTEGSVPKGSPAGAGDGEETQVCRPQVQQGGVFMEEVQ